MQTSLATNYYQWQILST